MEASRSFAFHFADGWTFGPPKRVPDSDQSDATIVEVDRDPIVEMCLTIDGYNTGRTSPTVRSNVGCFSGQNIEDLSS